MDAEMYIKAAGLDVKDDVYIIKVKQTTAKSPRNLSEKHVHLAQEQASAPEPQTLKLVGLSEKGEVLFQYSNPEQSMN